MHNPVPSAGPYRALQGRVSNLFRRPQRSFGGVFANEVNYNAAAPAWSKRYGKEVIASTTGR